MSSRRYTVTFFWGRVPVPLTWVTGLMTAQYRNPAERKTPFNLLSYTLGPSKSESGSGSKSTNGG